MTDALECRANPPTMQYRGPDDGSPTLGLWPEVSSDDWCGRFAADHEEDGALPPLDAEVRRLEIRPGDKVVIEVPAVLSEEARRQMMWTVRGAFGAQHAVLILDGGAHLVAVASPGGEDPSGH